MGSIGTQKSLQKNGISMKGKIFQRVKNLSQKVLNMLKLRNSKISSSSETFISNISYTSDLSDLSDTSDFLILMNDNFVHELEPPNILERLKLMLIVYVGFVSFVVYVLFY